MTRRAGFWSGEQEQDLRGPFFRSDITNRLHLLLLLYVLLCSILLAAINFVLLPNERLYGHVLRINFIPTPSSIAACRPTNFNLERNLFSGREGRRVMRETVLEIWRAEWWCSKREIASVLRDPALVWQRDIAQEKTLQNLSRDIAWRHNIRRELHPRARAAKA